MSTLHSVPCAGSAALVAVGPALVLLTAPAPAADYPSEAEALASFFPGAASIERELALVDEPGTLELRRDRTPRHLFRHVARGADGQLLGYAVVDDVLGKARPITYLLAVDAAGTVLGVEVLVYRESHGHEISREAFRRQFIGKDEADRPKLDGDIRNISGATISCPAITDGVADLLDLMGRIPAARVAPAEPAAEPDGGAAEVESTGRLVRTQVVMNTSLTLALQDADATRAELFAASDAAFAEARRLEGLFSVFAATSDVSRVNAGAADEPVAVAAETLELVGETLELAERTAGAYDPAAGALTRLVKAAGEAPNPAALEAARGQSGWRLVRIDRDTSCLSLTRRGAALDLGGSAKGYALDRIAALLRERGIEAGLLNFGGQVLTIGDRPQEIEDRGHFARVTVTNGGLATTGDDERAVPDARGARRSHLVDPRTGRGVPVHGAVQVFAESALEADALSTALYVLGPEAGWELCLEQGIAARFEVEPPAATHRPITGPGTERRTPAWERRFGAER